MAPDFLALSLRDAPVDVFGSNIGDDSSSTECVVPGSTLTFASPLEHAFTNMVSAITPQANTLVRSRLVVTFAAYAPGTLRG